MTNKEIIQGNKLIAEFMGFPKVTPMSVWNYDRSLDNASVTRGLVVNDVNKYGAKFQQRMPFDRYSLDYFDGRVFSPANTEIKDAPCRPYHFSWDWIMPAYKRFSEFRFDDSSITALHLNYCARINIALAAVEIKKVFRFLIIGINWYNTNLKP